MRGNESQLSQSAGYSLTSTTLSFSEARRSTHPAPDGSYQWVARDPQVQSGDWEAYGDSPEDALAMLDEVRKYTRTRTGGTE